jgi:drug/metabolite transporter (DMT)-like permease
MPVPISNRTAMPATDLAAAPPKSGDAVAYFALVAGAIAMGASPVFVRLADVGPFASAFWRVTLALPLLWAWVQLEERGAEKGASFALPTLLAGAAFTTDLLFWHLAITRTTVANATFFATTAPIWVVVFGWLLWRRTVAASVLLGLGLCLAGGAALVAQSLHVDPARATGDLLGVCTGVFFGLYFLAVKAARGRSGAARVTFELSVVTAILLYFVAWTLEPRLLPRTVDGWGAVIALGWISHLGGQGLLSVALGRLPPVFSSLVIFLEAIAAAFFGWLILQEPVTLVQGAGGLVIVLGIWVARPNSPGERKA